MPVNVEKFAQIDHAWLQRAFDENSEHESLHLEFKQVRNPERPFEHPDDRENLAKCLSGFANADGGVVVWGVDSRDQDGFNVLTGLPGLSVARALPKIHDLLHDAVAPPVVDLQILGFQSGTDRGFVKMLIPAGELEPHMAGGRDRRYYRRSGSSFQKMEHFEVASLFGRKSKPKVLLCHTIQRQWPTVQKGTAKITLSLKNEGLAYAWHPAIWISRGRSVSFDWKRNPRGISNELMRSMNLLSYTNAEGCGILERTPLFPGTSIDFEEITTTIRRPVRGGEEDLVFDYRIVAEAMPAVIGRYEISWATILGE